VNKINIVVLAACAAMASASVQAQTAASTPNPKPEAPRSRPTAESSALSMMARGDNWAATNMLKALVAKDGSALNRFNLATGYQRTGRLAQAKALYQGLLAEGRFTNISAVPMGGQGLRLFNAADEAASRLLYIQWLEDGGGERLKSAPLYGVTSADSSLVPVPALEGAPTGDVTDEEAKALDGRAKSRGAAPQVVSMR
jgi:hypothetical protein